MYEHVNFCKNKTLGLSQIPAGYGWIQFKNSANSWNISPVPFHIPIIFQTLQDSLSSNDPFPSTLYDALIPTRFHPGAFPVWASPTLPSREEPAVMGVMGGFGVDWREIEGFTLPETNSEFTPENGWLEYDCFLLGMAYFQVRAVSFRECTRILLLLNHWLPPALPTETLLAQSSKLFKTWWNTYTQSAQ